MSDCIVQNKEKVNREVKERMKILGFPEWVSDDYDRGVLCYSKNPSNTSQPLLKGSEIYEDVKVYLDQVPLVSMYSNDVPYYVVAQETIIGKVFFILTVEKCVQPHEWECEKKDMRKGWVRIWYCADGEIKTSGFPVKTPLKFETVPFSDGTMDKSGILLKIPTEEEYAEIGVRIC